MIIDASCRNPSYACTELDALIINEVTKLAHDQSAFLRIVNSNKQTSVMPDSKKDTLMHRIDELDAQIRRVLDLYQFGTISMDEIKSRVDKLETERDALAAQLEEDEDVKSSVLPPHVAQSLLQDFVSIAKSGDFAVIRDTLFELIQRIDVLPEKGQLQIIWNF